MWFLILRYLYFSLHLSIRVFPLPRLSSSPASLASFKYGYSAGISTCCPSDTPFGLSLGPDLPWADEPSPGNLRLSTALSSASSSNALALPSPYYRMLLYHLLSFNNKSVISVYSLAPVIFRANSLDQWAVTHSLNEWLLLSQHPGCLRKFTSFPT